MNDFHEKKNILIGVFGDSYIFLPLSPPTHTHTHTHTHAHSTTTLEDHGSVPIITWKPELARLALTWLAFLVLLSQICRRNGIAGVTSSQWTSDNSPFDVWLAPPSPRNLLVQT